MSASYAPTRHPLLARRSLNALGVLAAGLVLALTLSLVLTRYPPTVELAVVAGVALLGVLALALASQEAAAALGFALLGVVLIEPAPADLVFFVVIAVALATGGFHIQRASAAAVGIAGTLLALNLVSAVEVVDYERALTFFATTAYVAVLALWLASWVTNRRRAKVAGGGYVVAATLSASLGLLALFLPLPGGELMVFEDRVQALFKDPNVFGPFLVPAALILVEETLTPRLFGFSRLLKSLLLVVLSLGLIFSYSRGAWANLAVGVGMVLVVIALRRGGGRKALLALVLALVAGALVAGAVSLSGSSDFLADRARVQSYDADRFGAQAAGLEPAQRYPFGVGPGQFELVAPISAHSTYVRVFAEQGLPGITAFLALLIFTLGAALANAVAGRDTYGIGSAALLGAWCGLLVNSFVIDTLHWRHLWVVAALIWAGWVRRRLGSPRVSLPLTVDRNAPGVQKKARSS
jgi:O-antigen ligase